MSEDISQEPKKSPPTPITTEQVVQYLKQHPNFLVEHPELIEMLTPPKSDLGSGVADLQHYMLGGLQKELKTLRNTYNEIVSFCRDNQSTQSQVHAAVLSLISARDLEQLLQVLTIDLAALFDLDVVRLAMETEHVDFYTASYPDAYSSGISFISYGAVDACLGVNQQILLAEDIEESPVTALDEVFSDCIALVKSCVVLRLKLESVRRDAVLALGVRHSGRFHPHQGVDLLVFLAGIIEKRLDTALLELDPEAFA